jgi:OmpA-like transmembrane domain
MRAAAIIAFIVLAGSALGSPAGAAQLGIYAGVSFAMVEKDSDRSLYENEAFAIYDAFGFTPLSTVATFDAKDSAYGFVVGYRLAENLALEGGYMDLGNVVYRDRSDGVFDNTSPESWAQNVDTGSSGIALSALGILPLSYRWEVYGRAGLLLANSTETVFITDNIGSERLRGSKSTADLIGGIGISCSVVDIYNLRLEFQRVFDAGDSETLDESDADLLTLNVTVSF